MGNSINERIMRVSESLTLSKVSEGEKQYSAAIRHKKHAIVELTAIIDTIANEMTDLADYKMENKGGE